MQSEETKIEVLKTQMENLDKKVDSVSRKQDILSDKMDSFINEIKENYVTKGDFKDELNFWRNWIIGGVLAVVLAAIISHYLGVAKP